MIPGDLHHRNVSQPISSDHIDEVREDLGKGGHQDQALLDVGPVQQGSAAGRCQSRGASSAGP